MVCARQVETEDEEFEEEFVGSVDPSILHFLLASGDRISSKQVGRLHLFEVVKMTEEWASQLGLACCWCCPAFAIA